MDIWKIRQEKYIKVHKGNFGKRGSAMSHYMNYKSYIGTVEYSSEGDCLYGKVLGLKGMFSYEGQSIAELKEDFHHAVDEYLSFCKQKGIQPEKSFKGSFNVRVTPELHRMATIKADEKNGSLNTFVAMALARAVEA